MSEIKYNEKNQDLILNLFDSYDGLFNGINGIKEGTKLYFHKQGGLVSVNTSSNEIKISSALKDNYLLNNLEKLTN